jgi:DHA3 family macrolide efflux protein-like MFS transporter
MIAADLFVAVCSAVMSVLLLNGTTNVLLCYILLMLRSAGNAFHVPAMQASTPLLAPESELLRISGINQIIQSGGIIAGPPLAAFLISILKIPYVLYIDVIGAVIACISLMMVHIPNPEKKENAPAPHVFREMKEGLREIYSRKGLLWLFLIGILVWFFVLPVSALFPLLTLDYFRQGAYHVSIIEVAWGVGMLAGGAILGMKKIKISEAVLINCMYIMMGLTFAISGRLPEQGYWIFMILTFLGGISMTVYSSVFMVVLQKTVEPSALGRVFSLYGSITLVPSIAGLAFTGVIADRIGVPNAFLISGITIVFLGGISFFGPAPVADCSDEKNDETVEQL